ncbi:GH12355 [Drosophila grimshawi]|uniref:GH12355 n=1 Tax=Drosophila grimshawi TaxID=7222 RepID=B4JJ19_DROGR|nr:GH12355 [Drosophila grimshawi]
MYDEVLRLQLPQGCSLIGFADDLALVVVAKEHKVVETVANAAIKIEA